MLHNLPPGVTPAVLDRNVSPLDDADTESLWEACTDAQRQSIMDGFTSFYAGQITLDLSEGKVTAALRTWTTYRDEQLDRLAQDGEIKPE